MAFPGNIYAPSGVYTLPIPPIQRGVLDTSCGTYHNIFVGSRFVGMHPNILDRVGIALDIVHYVTDDIDMAESLVFSFWNLSPSSLICIRQQLRAYDQFHGCVTPVW